MFDEIKQYVSDNKFVLFIALCIVSSVIVPLMFNQMPYIAALGLMAVSQMSRTESFNAPVFLLLVLVLFVSTVATWAFSARFFVFLFVIVVASGMLYSDDNLSFRCRVLSAVFNCMFVANIMNIFAYFAGVNYYEGKYIGFQDYFSGYTPHPMWLAVVSGVANVVNVHKFLQTDSKWLRAGLVGLFLLTLFLQFTAGSRSGLMATGVGVVVYLKSRLGNMSKVVTYVVVGGLLVYALLPMLMSDASLFQNKVDTQDVDDNSRTELWAARISEFRSSPIFGIGFARGYVDGELVEGRLETGSGWLAVLSQTGLFAFICIAAMAVSIFRSIGTKWLPEKELFFAVFVFLCVHSVFEGYLYTSFYMPCLLFWMLTGTLLQAPPADEVIDDEEEEDSDDTDTDQTT